MRLSTKEEVAAPVDFVWELLSDFVVWERIALRRGVEVQRLDGTPKDGPGMGWLVRFPYQGKPREIDLRLASVEPGQRLVFEGQGHSLRAHLSLEVIQIDPRRTRVAVISEVKPMTITARMIIQSLRLAKGKIQTKFDRRIAGLAADLEDRWKARSRG